MAPRHGPVLHDDGSVTFSVWAPLPARVELVVDGRREALERLADGWWRLRTAAAAGSRYGFSLDGGEPRPDPASRRQPDGVHGLSEVVDPARLGGAAVPEGRRPPDLLGGAIYELHVGTFTPEGTLDAAARRIGHLPELGITHVELMPLNAFNGDRGWGYDGVCWFAVHEPYGGPEALARFVAACHDAGLAVVVDVVHNHLGPSGNYLPELGPYMGAAGLWGAGLNLDGPDSDPVRQLIIENVQAWFGEHGVDALRLDAVHALHDTSATHILAAIADATAELSGRLRRPLLLIAESDRNDPATLRPRELGGLGMDAQWADELHHALHVAITGEHDTYYADLHPDGLPDVAQAYRWGFVLDGRRYSPFRRRTVGAPLPDEVDGRRLIGCLQNHDQIGNRPAGDRLLATVEPALVRAAVLLLCAAPHTPMLFMGEEHGETNPFAYFTSHPEPALAEAVRKGRALEFPHFVARGALVPDPQSPETFERSRLDWSRADSDEGLCWLALWGDLLAARREHPALGGGRRDLVSVHVADGHVLSLTRGGPDGDAVVVVANLSPQPALLPAPGAEAVLLTTDDLRYGGAGEELTLTDGQAIVPAKTAALLLPRAG